jgi:hypothetical protein
MRESHICPKGGTEKHRLYFGASIAYGNENSLYTNSNIEKGMKDLLGLIWQFEFARCK